MDPNNRLRIATRLHFALLRHLGDSPEVQDILHRPAETREVLWVCDASGDAELIALAAQFRKASRPAAPVVESRAPAQASAGADSGWSRDSSGFGPSRLPGTPEAERPEREWFRPSTWLRPR